MLTQRLCFSGTEDPKAKPQIMSPQSMVCSRGSPDTGITCFPSLFWRDKRRGLKALVPSPSWPTELQQQRLQKDISFGGGEPGENLFTFNFTFTTYVMPQENSDTLGRERFCSDKGFKLFPRHTMEYSEDSGQRVRHQTLSRTWCSSKMNDKLKRKLVREELTAQFELFKTFLQTSRKNSPVKMWQTIWLSPKRHCCHSQRFLRLRRVNTCNWVFSLLQSVLCQCPNMYVFSIKEKNQMKIK